MQKTPEQITVPNTKRAKRQWKRERAGTSIVEVALVLPIFFTVIFASFEFARLMMITHSAEVAAMEAARMGVTPGATESQVSARVASEMAAVDIETYTATCQFQTNNDKKQIFVAIDVPLVQGNTWIQPVVMSGVVIRREFRLDTEFD